MTQGILPFKYDILKNKKKFTGLAGLLLYLELFQAMGLDRIIRRNVDVKRDRQGWSDEQVVSSLLLLNLAGGDCVDDIEKLEMDEGFRRILEKMELRGKNKREREKIRTRWRKAKVRGVCSQSSIFRYLAYYHDDEEEAKRVKGKAFIPAMNSHLSKLVNVNSELIEYLQKREVESTATIDMDAQLVETYKITALNGYKGYKCYQPLNVRWHEQDMMLYTEFRDGNVPAGFEQLRVFIESLLQLPEGVEEVYLRSDSAGYQHELLRYCELGKNERFGRIGFAIGCDISESFKESLLNDGKLKWHPIWLKIGSMKIKSNQQWAEICYIPKDIAFSKKAPEYRYIAIREELSQRVLPGMEDQLDLPFPTITIGNKRYKLTGVVSNLQWSGEEIIHWYRKRCGKSEEIHSVMKKDFAGGQFPSGDFGENAAWWWIMILSVNLNSIMKQLVLGKKWKNKRMKAIRYHIINLPAHVTYRDSQFIVRLSEGHPSFKLLINARRRIWELACLPSG